MNNLITTDVKMTSLDIAEVTGKRHADVMKDIRRGLKHGFLSEKDFSQSSYIDKNNQERPCYNVTDNGFEVLLSRYKTTKRRNRPNTLYIVKHIGMDGYYKIGVTSNLDGRLKVLDNASPLGIRLVYKVIINNAMKLETHIHNYLSDKNTNLEWFKLNEKDLNGIINFIDGGYSREFVS